MKIKKLNKNNLENPKKFYYYKYEYLNSKKKDLLN
jgi:hypothetical protein